MKSEEIQAVIAEKQNRLAALRADISRLTGEKEAAESAQGIAGADGAY
jgi:uncharacterized small protein (DUF1192 family)